MPGLSKLFGSALAAIIATPLLIAAPHAARADAPAAAPQSSLSCFFATQWRGWSSPDPRTVYLRVNINDIYRVTLASDAYGLHVADRHLVSIVRGGDSICTALDLDLTVADNTGFREHLFPTAITKLTPAEAQAIPAKFRP